MFGLFNLTTSCSLSVPVKRKFHLIVLTCTTETDCEIAWHFQHRIENNDQRLTLPQSHCWDVLRCIRINHRHRGACHTRPSLHHLCASTGGQDTIRNHDVFMSSAWIWEIWGGLMKKSSDRSQHNNAADTTRFQSGGVLQYFWAVSVWSQNRLLLLWFAQRHELYENKQCLFEPDSVQNTAYSTRANFSCVFLGWNKQTRSTHLCDPLWFF